MNELKPCPICNCAEITKSHNSNTFDGRELWTIGCTSPEKCGLQISGYGEQETCDKWNTRTITLEEVMEVVDSVFPDYLRKQALEPAGRCNGKIRCVLDKTVIDAFKEALQKRFGGEE